MTIERQLPRADQPSTDGTVERPAKAARTGDTGWRRWVAHPPRRVLIWCAVALIVIGVGMRSWATSPLWLDEAQSVAIARLPFDKLFAALLEDGSPPLYYLLLHVWMMAFGQSDIAVRGLSGLISVATLPLLWGLVRRLSASRSTAWVAVVLLATSPFAIRYATETRMYALIIALTVLGGYALLALRRRGPLPIVAVAGVSAALALTHYWTFFLLGIVGAALLWLAVRRRDGDLGRIGRRGLIGLAAGAIPFLPWLPSFIHQLRYTGAPWADPAWFTSVGGTVDTWSGGGLPGQILGYLFWALAAVGLAGRTQRRRLVFALPVRPSTAILVGLAFAPIVLGIAVGHLLGTAYADRYSSVGFVAFLVVVAYGIAALPQRFRYHVVGGAALLGLLSAIPVISYNRTQAGEVAEIIKAKGRPGDIVVICPDQLGPAIRRLMPSDRFRHVAYPTFEDTTRVDWTNYEERNEAADPEAFAQRVYRVAGGHAVWYAYADGYRTLRYDCSALRGELLQRYGDSRTFVRDKGWVLENEKLIRFARRS